MRPRWRQGYRGATTIALLLLVAVLAVGCTDLPGGSDQTTGTVADSTTESLVPTTAMETTTSVDVATSDTAPPTSTVSTTPPATTATTEALSSAEERLPNGNIRAMGYIDEVFEYGVRTIRIDYAEFLTGAEADAAAVAAGLIPPGESVDNGYYISNVNPLKRTFDVSDSVAITTATRSGGFDQPATWNQFMSWWGPSPAPGTEHLHAMPWWIERDGDVVVKIDEQYLP